MSTQVSIMSHSQDIINTPEIIELVRLLRQNGDKILSASSKLSLSTKLLYNLNQAFSLIISESEDLNSSFHVCNSSKIDIFRDVKFLHDFVQKTVGLKVIHCSSDIKVTIDISKFRHLKYLELKEVSVELLKGLQSIRGQLESIVCTGRKGISTIYQLLAECGGDAGVGFVWASLRHLVLPHNALKYLDKSLELAPWLQILDLSHNMITNAKELSCLSNLRYVNLGYNKLEEIPIFNKTVLHSLQVLVLKNNYIENLNGLEGLECLTELDLSFNCLMEHLVLSSLQKMSTLLWLTLEGNPLSYHPKHRILTIKYLHPSLSDSKFVLDHLSLSNAEKMLIAENQIFAIPTNQSTSLTSSISIYADTYEFDQDRLNRAISLPENLEKNLIKSKRRPNVKEAVIDEIDQERGEFKKLPDVVASSHLESSKDYLETKKRILDLRAKFGENNWLSSHAGTFVQHIMGLQSASESPESQISKIQTLTSINTASSLHDTLIYAMDNEKSSNESQEITEYTEDDKEISQNKTLDDLPKTYAAPMISYDPNEEIGDLYIVQKKNNEDEMESVFLVITSEDIKERDTITGKIKFCWSTNSLLSCVLGRSDPPTVDIIFDTTRKDKESRRYFAQLDDAKKIVTVISEQIEMRPILLKIFKCMKCSTQFSQDPELYVAFAIKSMTGTKIKCPTCDSSLVIEIETSSNADNQVTKSQLTDNQTRLNLAHSESFSSIGGMEGGAKSVTTSLVHSDSRTQAQVCCSATSLEESRESTPSANIRTKKYESDIEILSNPSQSSIEVLDETLKANVTPSRKCSTEEKRTVIAPSLITIPNVMPIMTGLTESSSSGSLTDSICTAYENKMVKSNIDTKSHSSDGEKEIAFAPMTNLTSMLGGLLQSIKYGNKTLKSEEASNFFGSNVQYSYTDFSSVDHRIKLHIILHVFEHENEELVFLLKANILLHSMQETFSGCLILSTSKVYVLRIDGSEGEDPQRWLHKEISWTTDRLRSIVPLPFKQGVLIELQQSGKAGEEHLVITLLCILQDFQRTSNFLFYITDLQLPASCEVEFSIPERYSILMHNILTNTANYQTGDIVRLLAIFSSAILKYQNIAIKLKLSGLILTGAALVILKDNVQWLIPDSDQVPLVTREQAISNLIGIEHCDTWLTLNFLDEIAGLEESWTLEFVSSGAVEAVISSIQPPWEELFSVPLQITRVTQDDAEEA
ncbi:PREDICTED: serine/threonine-protein kinase 11-interacting protein isoform X1 [Cyphomyrmex costatus]|uniref:serine/threonine-protein kinase 11-interacting protein isoform X1 n=1 Tax=Cyphomyrmex costatus TaxID=456900 RepID=UPI0008523CB1|nr:PREDICTED: serine/threonine-protein kinase 11-interacting protein isoform X1 [Cyphomyrmex costatus]XP_018393307.1 PREDICTED: serine/threonine-protein kinase 11-interacting protein isoform X1 [Cyphomyrmex costatus]